MASSNQDCCFFGRGELFMTHATDGQSWGYNWGLCWGTNCADNAPGRFVGNVSELSLSINYEQKQVLNLNGNVYESDCSMCLIEGVEFSMRLSCYSDANLREALLANVYQIAPDPTPVTDHFALPTSDVPFTCGTFIPFNNPGVDPTTVVVIRTDTLTPLILDIDYTVDSVGIKLLSDFLFPSGVGLQLSYSYAEGYRSIEPLTRDCENVRLMFKGKNIANKCSPFLVTLYNVKISPASALELINDSEFPELEITGTLDPDKSITTPGFSQYFNIKRLGGV